MPVIGKVESDPAVRRWFRRWLGIEEQHSRHINLAGAVDDLLGLVSRQHHELSETIHLLQNEIRELRVEVTRLSIAAYVPPQPAEDKRKVVPTRTFKEFSAIVDRDIEELEARNASN